MKKTEREALEVKMLAYNFLKYYIRNRVDILHEFKDLYA